MEQIHKPWSMLTRVYKLNDGDITLYKFDSPQKNFKVATYASVKGCNSDVNTIAIKYNAINLMYANAKSAIFLPVVDFSVLADGSKLLKIIFPAEVCSRDIEEFIDPHVDLDSSTEASSLVLTKKGSVYSLKLKGAE